MHCREEEKLVPEPMDDEPTSSQGSDPLVGNLSRDEHSLDDTRFDDPDESVTIVKESTSAGQIKRFSFDIDRDRHETDTYFFK